MFPEGRAVHLGSISRYERLAPSLMWVIVGPEYCKKHCLSALERSSEGARTHFLISLDHFYLIGPVRGSSLRGLLLVF